MTRNLLSGRISGSGLVSFGDNQIVQFENDVADVFGIPTDTVLSNPVMAVDSDGNITRWTNADDPGDPEYGVLTFKDGNEENGFRIWDTASGKEIWVLIDSNAFVIREAATPGQALTGTWHTKLSIPLAGAAGQEIDLDLSGQASKYLICKADETGIGWAAAPALAVPSCQVVMDTDETILNVTAENLIFEDPADWELNDTDMWQATYPGGILIPTAGAYLIQAYVHWDSIATGYVRAKVRGVPGGAVDPPVFTTDLLVDTRVATVSDEYHHTFSGIVDLAASVFVGLEVYQATGASVDVLEATLAVSLIATDAA